MKIQLRSTNLKSGSLKRVAKELSNRVGYKVLRTKWFNPRRKQYVYGGMVDKLAQYQWFSSNNIPCPEFTTSISVARDWVSTGHVVFSRTLLRSSEGKGIVVAETVDQLVAAPVYTKYFKKKREYRVHIFKDTVVRVLEKRRRSGVSHNLIRNTSNGYVFCRDLSNPVDPRLLDLALQARKVTQSDFAGVDIGYNEQKNLYFVIEVNSAPGIEGTNVLEYADTILQQ